LDLRGEYDEESLETFISELENKGEVVAEVC
jgi:hypothetical protein